MRNFLLILALFICISRARHGEPHDFVWPETGNGHVACGERVVDAAREAYAECEVAHGEDSCDLFCFLSRGEDERLNLATGN